MIFPSLRCPVARAGPKGFIIRPPLRMILRVSWGWRRHQSAAAPEIKNLNLYGPRTGRATDPVVEAST